MLRSCFQISIFKKETAEEVHIQGILGKILFLFYFLKETFSYEEFLDYDEYQAWLDAMITLYGTGPKDQPMFERMKFGGTHQGIFLNFKELYLKNYHLAGLGPSWRTKYTVPAFSNILEEH